MLGLGAPPETNFEDLWAEENAAHRALKLEMAALEEKYRLLKLFVKETGELLTNPMYEDADNRMGLSEDCRGVYEDWCGLEYLDKVKYAHIFNKKVDDENT